MADKCGFGCNFKKSMGQLSLGFKQQMYERKEKKAKSYGFASYGEWEKEANKARERGYSKAGQKRLKEIEKKASGQNIAGGPSNLSRGLALFDEYMGAKPAPKRRKAPVKRKTTARPQKRPAKPKRRGYSNKQKDPFDYGDFF